MTPQDAALLASLTGFTPGPWNTDESDHDQPYQKIKVGQKHRRVCTVWQDDAPEHDYNREQYCNADLIAAAPDLHRIATEQAAEIERLRSALGTLMPHVKTGKEQAEFAANERQDTPATEALVNAAAALAAKS